MDESWRMRIGYSAARKSTDQTLYSAATMEANDFADVFGGPPRSVLTRNYSGDCTRSNSFYDEIFQASEFGHWQLPSSKSHGRNLPAFRIPAGGDGFYGDVFRFSCGGGGGRRRERARRKLSSNSSSLFTSDDVSRPRPPGIAVSGNDVTLSSFTSTLRPLNVPSRSRIEQHLEKQGILAFGKAGDFIASHKNTLENANFYYGSSGRTLLDTLSLDLNSFRNNKILMDDIGPSSLGSSPVSSVCDEIEQKQRTSGLSVEDSVDEEDEVMCSFAIEINSDHHDHVCQGGASDTIDIDEAIAWAKERFLRPDTKPQETECQSHESFWSTSLKSTTTVLGNIIL